MCVTMVCRKHNAAVDAAWRMFFVKFCVFSLQFLVRCWGCWRCIRGRSGILSSVQPRHVYGGVHQEVVHDCRRVRPSPRNSDQLPSSISTAQRAIPCLASIKRKLLRVVFLSYVQNGTIKLWSFILHMLYQLLVPLSKWLKCVLVLCTAAK